MENNSARKCTVAEGLVFRLDDRNATALILLFTLFAAGIFTALVLFVDRGKPPITFSDQAYYYSYARSLAIDRDLDLTNEYEYFGLEERVTESGRPGNRYSIGFPVLVLPFYLIAHVAVILLNQFGFAISSSGYSLAYQLSFCYGSIFYGFFGLLVAYRFLRRFFDEAVSFFSVATIFLSSNLVYYYMREPFLSHLTCFFMVSLFIYSWHSVMEGDIRWKCLVMGFAAGMMVLIRQQNIAFLSIPVIDMAANIISRRKAGPIRPWYAGHSNLAVFFLGLWPRRPPCNCWHGSQSTAHI